MTQRNDADRVDPVPAVDFSRSTPEQSALTPSSSPLAERGEEQETLDDAWLATEIAGAETRARAYGLDTPTGRHSVDVAGTMRRIATRLASRRAAAADTEDAERWRALVGCQRVRVLGHARLGQPDQHIGVEFWEQYPVTADEASISELTVFADAAAARASRPDPEVAR
jgi:hypothetical protein